MKKLKNKKIKPRKQDCTVTRGTLCWGCQNSIPSPSKGLGCNWSRSFEPVKGWTAKKVPPSSYVGKNSEKDGYFVIKCPEFLPD